jgi:hypothetical protein
MKAMRGLIALQKHSCEIHQRRFLFREALGVRARPRVALRFPNDFLGDHYFFAAHLPSNFAMSKSTKSAWLKMIDSIA